MSPDHGRDTAWPGAGSTARGVVLLANLDANHTHAAVAFEVFG